MKLKDNFIVKQAFVYKVINSDKTEIMLHPGDILKITLTNGAEYNGYLVGNDLRGRNALVIKEKSTSGITSIAWYLIANIVITGRQENADKAWDVSEPISLQRP